MSPSENEDTFLEKRQPSNYKSNFKPLSRSWRPKSSRRSKSLNLNQPNHLDRADHRNSPTAHLQAEAAELKAENAANKTLRDHVIEAEEKRQRDVMRLKLKKRRSQRAAIIANALIEREDVESEVSARVPPPLPPRDKKKVETHLDESEDYASCDDSDGSESSTALCVKEKHRRQQAVCRIHQAVLCYLARTDAWKRRSAVRVTQCFMRQILAIMIANRRLYAVVQIQCTWREYTSKFRVEKRRVSILKVQSAVRRTLSMKSAQERRFETQIWLEPIEMEKERNWYDAWLCS